MSHLGARLCTILLSVATSADLAAYKPFAGDLTAWPETAEVRCAVRLRLGEG
jgi:hypothetical protein